MLILAYYKLHLKEYCSLEHFRGPETVIRPSIEIENELSPFRKLGNKSSLERSSPINAVH